MSTTEIIKKIKSLPQEELHVFLTQLLQDEEISEELERLGYLRLTEKAFEFWNDPREDVYQDYVRQGRDE